MAIKKTAEACEFDEVVHIADDGELLVGDLADYQLENGVLVAEYKLVGVKRVTVQTVLEAVQ